MKIKIENGIEKIISAKGNTRLLAAGVLAAHGGDPIAVWNRLNFFGFSDSQKITTLVEINAAQAAHDQRIAAEAAQAAAQQREIEVDAAALARPVVMAKIKAAQILADDLREIGETPSRLHAAAERLRRAKARAAAKIERAENKWDEKLRHTAARVAAKAPKHPVIGHGFDRVEVNANVHDVINGVAGAHVALVSTRSVINRHGKIGYPKTAFCSPEMSRALARLKKT